MPALYCRPANALANRLMGLSSCLRLARRWNYDLVLVWEYGFGSFFATPFTDLFDGSFETVSNDLPPDVSIRTLRRVQMPGDRNFFEKPRHGDDVYVDGWRHFCFDAEDAGQSPAVITEEIRSEYIRSVQVSSQVTDIVTAFGGSFETEYDLGVHIRKGALEWIGIGDICTTSQIVQFYVAIANHIGPEKIYISGTSPKDNLEFLLGIRGMAQDIRVSAATSFDANLLNHALAIGDLYQLSRCKAILKMGHTTYSSFAALIGKCDLYAITSPTNLVQQRPEVLSGIGL